MNHLLTYLEKKTPIDYDIRKYECLYLKKSNLFGFVIDDETLFFDYANMNSFRCKIENLSSSQVKRLYGLSIKTIDKDFIKYYFYENRDNPFAINYIMQQLHTGIMINRENINTQFPPLKHGICIEEAKSKLIKIIPKLKTGDLILTFDRKSNISKLIRNIDKSQWSHCGIMYDSETIYEMSTDGAVKSSIYDLDLMQFELAFYRRTGEIHANVADAQQYMDKMVRLDLQYNWIGILKIFLFRKYKFFRFLRSKNPLRDISPSEIINSNNFKLIDYV